MDQIYLSDTVASAPTAPAAPATGFPTDGDPIAGQEATSPGAYWFHMITRELLSVITYAGITPDHDVVDQVKDALIELYGSGRPGHAFSTPAWVPLAGGMILQYGNATTVGGGLSLVFPFAFPNNCFQALPVLRSGSVSPVTVSANVPTKTGVGIYSSNTSGVGVSADFSWFAIGN